MKVPVRVPRYTPVPSSHGNRKMKRTRRLSSTTFLVLFVAMAVGACGDDARAGDAAGTESQATGQASFQRVINVEVQRVEPQPFQEIIRVTGTVQANQDVTLSAEESGVVRELLVPRGASVGQGDPLVRIDDAILQPQVREAEARAALAQESWERRRRLFEDDRVGSELAYLEARYQAEQAEAQLATLRERLGRTIIRAPIRGVVDERMVEVGTMVSAGTPVVRMVQIDPVKVQGGVPERFAGDVRPGASARVTFDVLRGEVFQADVRFVGSTVNPRNRTFEVELALPNPGRIIKPEMVANLELSRRDLTDALVIPQNALVRVEEGFVVFVAVDEDGQGVAQVRPVRLGPAQRNLVVVEEGLDPGDRLIVVGQNQVANGDRIQVVGERGRPPVDAGTMEESGGGGER
ncbi:MAG: efflux RND transporter periplasmic adaptor subunit [Gemmatimonadales bacterium]|nr:MAG: efflux RND transporter periplasmic adaptor subunit [Gemmatimonadales bacterium]